MPRHEIKRSCCGVVETIDIPSSVGNRSQREYKAQQIAHRVLCDDCASKARAEANAQANAQAAESAVAAALPPLQGSDKQVAWSNTIRDGILKQFESRLAHFEQADDEQLGANGIANRETLRNVIKNLKLITVAKWWIEHRDFPLPQLAKLLSA